MKLPDSVTNTSYTTNREQQQTSDNNSKSDRTTVFDDVGIFSTSDIILGSGNNNNITGVNASSLAAEAGRNYTAAKTTMRALNHRQQPGQSYMQKTTDFYDTYDPSVGLRTAAALGGFLVFIIAYSLYKTKCRRNRWTDDDKVFIERYSKLLADKWSGKTPPRPPPPRSKTVKRSGEGGGGSSMRSSKCSVANTAEWVQSQPLHEVSMLQDTMYKICMESFKATACQVCSLSDLRGSTNLLMKPPIRDSYLKQQNNSSLLDYATSNSQDDGGGGGLETGGPLMNNAHIPSHPSNKSSSAKHRSIDIDLRLPFPKSRSLDEKLHSSLTSSLIDDKPYVYSKLPTDCQYQAVPSELEAAELCPIASMDSQEENLSRQANSSGKTVEACSLSLASVDLFSPMTIETSSDSDSLDYCYSISSSKPRQRQQLNTTATKKGKQRPSLTRQQSLDSTDSELARFMMEEDSSRCSRENSQSRASLLLPHQRICIPELHYHEDTSIRHHHQSSSGSLNSNSPLQTSPELLSSSGSRQEEDVTVDTASCHGQQNHHICIPEIRISCDSLHKNSLESHSASSLTTTTDDIIHAQISESAQRLNRLHSERKASADLRNGDVIIALRDLNKRDTAAAICPASEAASWCVESRT